MLRRPLAVVDESGTPVTVSAPGGHGPLVDGLLARVGDPVPIRVGSRSWPAEALVAAVIADAAAAVADTPAEHLVLVVPDEWRAHRRAALRDALVELTDQSVTMVDAGLGLIDPGTREELTGSVLVLTAGDESFRADVFTHGEDGWQVDRTSCSDWGGNDIDDALAEFIDHRSPSTPAPAQETLDAVAVRAACTSARADLARRTATEVELPGRDPVRLVRADLELLAGGTVTDVVDQLVDDVIDPVGARPSTVLVTGSLTSLPMVVEAVSGALGMSVAHVTDSEALRRYAEAGAAVMESGLAAEPVDADPVAADEDDAQETQLLPIAPLPSVGHRGHRRRTAVLVAASLALAAPVAAVAMSMTDAGEATLLSLVDGVVPQDSSSSDSTSDDVLDSLADAAILPALPWGDSDEADADAGSSAATNGAGESADRRDDSTGDDTTGPSPTSTHGPKDKKGSDKGTDPDDRDESENGKKKKGGDEKKKDKDTATKSTAAGDTGSDKASPRSSSKGTTSNTSSKPSSSSTGRTPTSSHAPSSTSGKPAGGTSSPSTSAPGPTPSSPRPSTTPAPTPTPTPTPTPAPEPSTSTTPSSEPSVTSSASTTTPAPPATSEQTTSAAPGQS
ncbi:hypothetical protein [Janibacter alittae]|uniref:Hsp70 protein n=1 Tax=Janibacter alittae TaxID=3115209 RepID=A0ABZ2MJR8_9MICO